MPTSAPTPCPTAQKYTLTLRNEWGGASYALRDGGTSGDVIVAGTKVPEGAERNVYEPLCLADGCYAFEVDIGASEAAWYPNETLWTLGAYWDGAAPER